MIQQYLLARLENVSLCTDSVDEPSFVYVEVDSNDGRQSRASATVKIPAAVWEQIRHETATLYDLADIPDREIRKRACHHAQLWQGLERLLKPYESPFKALLGMKRAYHLPTDYNAVLRALREQRKAQQQLRKSLNQLQSTSRDE